MIWLYFDLSGYSVHPVYILDSTEVFTGMFCTCSSQVNLYLHSSITNDDPKIAHALEQCSARMSEECFKAAEVNYVIVNRQPQWKKPLVAIVTFGINFSKFTPHWTT